MRRPKRFEEEQIDRAADRSLELRSGCGLDRLQHESAEGCSEPEARNRDPARDARRTLRFGARLRRRSKLAVSRGRRQRWCAGHRLFVFRDVPGFIANDGSALLSDRIARRDRRGRRSRNGNGRGRRCHERLARGGIVEPASLQRDAANVFLDAAREEPFGERLSELSHPAPSLRGRT